VPRPVGKAAAYIPGLDGLRAVAVIAVVAYHLNIGKAQGGLLGVGIFFTLSGFLITSILLRTYRRTGSMGFKNFWLHRARRLLPAVVLVITVVLLITALADPVGFHQRLVEGVGALFYVNNWVVIHQGQSYFARFHPDSGAFDHLWSLSVEEQFYLIWPILLYGLLKLCKGRLGRVALITAGLATVSFALLWIHSSAGFDNTRAYEGTDTRAGALLIGALVAMLWRPSGHARRVRAGARVLLDAVAVVAFAVIVDLIATTGQYSLSLYHSGLLILSIATAALVAVVVHPGADADRVFGVAPLRWIGERSYGIYLWQLPIIVAFPAAFLRSTPWLRDLVICAVIAGVSTLSWRYLEDPIRRHGFKAGLRELMDMTWASDELWRRRTTRLVTVGLVVAVGAGAVAVASTPSTSSAAPSSSTVVSTTSASTATTVANPAALRTGCRTVTEDGDSTSDGLVSDNYLPNRSEQLPAQLAAVGAPVFENEISGAQSINETWHGEPNAQQRVNRLLQAGVRGCWIFALGTNDTADVTAGSSMGIVARINAVMAQVHGQPTMWLTLKTLNSSGYYSDANMQGMNAALVQACARYPNLRVYDWRSEVQNSWYINDGIHFTSFGYKERAARMAHALARAFPHGQASPASCLVSSGIPG